MWSSLLALAIVAQNVHAMLRFPCSELVVERFDPLVTPGLVSPHLHQIVGGNAFNITMDPTNDLPKLSTCTSCSFSEDFSNYWTAVLFFKHQNGSLQRVPQMAGQGTNPANGGMTVYYHPGTRITSANKKVTSFKKGFRMIVGDAMTRAMDTSSAEAKALTFRCFSANFGNNRSAPGDGLNDGSDSYALPQKACTGGIRSQIYFPTCWNGKDLDTPDHKSHMAYAVNGNCPTSHPTAMPQLFLETVWDTTKFNNMPGDPKTPFVYSMGDPTGYGQHADYVFGWKDDTLQRAMDNCANVSAAPIMQGCSALKSQSVADANKCQLKARVPETLTGWLNALPGCNTIQSGPGKAVPGGDCGAPTTWS